MGIVHMKSTCGFSAIGYLCELDVNIHPLQIILGAFGFK